MQKSTGGYRDDILTCTGAVLIGCIALVLVMQLWKADLKVPFSYGAPLSQIGHTDRMGFFQHIKDLQDTGSSFHNPYVGAPGGMDLRLFPQHEQLHFLIFRVLNFFTHNWAVTANLFYLLGVPLTIITAFIAARQLGVMRPPAFVLALLYGFLPYHFLRGMDHLTLGAFWQVPLGVMVAMWGWLGVDLVRSYRPLRLTGRGTAAVVIALILGFGGLYYACFTAMFLLFAWFVRAVCSRRLWTGIDALLPVGFILLALFIQMIPTIQYHRTTHENIPPVGRRLTDAEVYALKIAQLVLPVPGHRNAMLAAVTQRYDEATLVNENRASALGIVGAAGFAVLLLWMLRCRLWRAGGAVTGALAEMNLIAVLFGTFGGGAILLAMLAGSYLRSANRISVFIAFFSLLALAYPARWFFQGSARRALLGGVCLAAVLVLGLLDQTSPDFVPDYAADRAHFTSDHEFVAAVEEALPPGAMVYQLPYVMFPESELADYQHFRGYLHSRQLRWSYGSVRFTISDQWARMVAGLAPQQMITHLHEAGFAGIYIDRLPMRNARAFEEQLRSLLRASPIESANGRLVFYRLN